MRPATRTAAALSAALLSLTPAVPAARPVSARPFDAEARSAPAPARPERAPALSVRAPASPDRAPASPERVPASSAWVPVPSAWAPVAVARFRWPLDGVPRPVRRFDPPPRPWLPGHRGVDLAAAPGATVRAAGAGTVLFAGVVAGRPVVTVGHHDGLRTTHEPVSPLVRAGDPLAAGAPLGTLLAGHPGCPAPACLHWGLRRGTDYLDPLSLLGLGPVRLLPLDGASG